MHSITTRFAPSPTGYIHAGTARTALFAWLYARQQGGKFIFRIEDTDKARQIVGAEEHIIQSLHWLGIEWDEGPGAGGPAAPYRQSERLDIYRQWAQKLIDSGRAYADPYTPEEVEGFRTQAIANKKPFLYRAIRPQNPPAWDGTQPLRFKSEPKKYTWHDEVLGELSAGPDAVDDFIIMKSDGYPTYNFCHIVDDNLMGVTHVIRSQEFIASVPKFLNLYEALDVPTPTFATLPYVMALEGNKKLSKREGAKDILSYAKEGYLPEAMCNFLATLGWNDGTEKEIFSKEDLLAAFNLSHVQKSPARFDEKRLLWMNGQWIRSLHANDLAERTKDYWPTSAKNYDDTYKRSVLAICQDRLKTLSDLPALSEFFFTEPAPQWHLVHTNKQLKKLNNDTICSLLTASKDVLASVPFTLHDITNALNQLLATTNQKPAVLFSLIRLSLTWTPFSPGLAESMEVLGKDVVMTRLQTALNSLQS